MPKVVLIIGSDSSESLESSYARVFRELGWMVAFWNPSQALHQVARGHAAGKLFSTFVHVESWERKANLDLLQRAETLQPALVLLIATTGVRGGTLAQLKVRLPNCVIYCLYPDSPHNLDDQRIHCLPFCDRVTASSPSWVSAFQSLGARRVHYLPFAADTHLHSRPHVSSADTALASDVVFIGTWRLEREQMLESLADFDLRIWGSAYWKTRTRPHSPLRDLWAGRPLVGSEFAQACAQSKISLNIMDAVTWPGPNMRAFELPACGAFALVERSPALLEMFCEGETIECYASTDEAREKIRYYLEHEEERKRIAQAAHGLVLQQGHTYLDRARTLLGWLDADS